MFIRKRRKFISLASGLLLASSVLAAVVVGTASPASAAPEITICLTNASQFCADVEDSVNRSGQPLWLYSPAAGAHDYHWYEVSYSCAPGTCYKFEDAQDTSLCIYAPSVTAGQVRLGNCGASEAQWYASCFQYQNHLVSMNLGPFGALTVFGPLYNGRFLYAQQCVGSGGATWQAWSGW